MSSILRLTACFLLLSMIQRPLAAQSSSFEIVTSPIGDDAREAIDYAADIWAELLLSSQPIKVRISFLPVPAGSFLGTTVPNGEKNFTGAQVPDVWYPSCLANAITGTELNPGKQDMDIFVPAGENWYFGTDGMPGPGQFDFVSLILHEIGHGLGVLSLAKVDGDGSFGEITEADLPFLPSFDLPDLEGLPSIYDYFLEDQGGTSLQNAGFYPNPSPELGDAMTGNQVYFNGTNAVAANGGVVPRIYAPSFFDPGSSITHLNETTYNMTDNDLMTPFLSSAEVNHIPGPIILGLLRDIGWGVNDGTTALAELSSNQQLNVWPNPASSHCRIKTGTDTHLQITDLSGQVLLEKEGMGEQTFINLTDLSPGYYLVVESSASSRRTTRLLINR